MFFLVYILLGISRNKSKELRERKNAAKSCEEISVSAEESEETVDRTDHQESLSNKSSQKVQKGKRLLYLFPTHSNSCRLTLSFFTINPGLLISSF